MPAEPKCPYCEKPITLWAVMKAPLPSSIRCPHCRQKIRVQGVGVFLVAYLVIAAVLATALIIARRRNQISFPAEIAVVVIALVILEVITSRIVMRRAKFTKP
jgi:hypothetical protein